MNKYDKFYSFKNPSSIAVGNFDGMHLGHQELFNNYSEGLTKCILTFNSLNKTKHEDDSYLTSLEDKEQIGKQFGIEKLLYLDFDDGLKNTSPEDFVNLYLKKENLKEIIIGEDFHYGKFGKGCAKDLKEKLKDINVKIIPLLDDNNGQKISTTEIISLIKDGKISSANKLLGRNYKIRGKIEEGFRNGHKIGFPTANILPTFKYTIPQKGVYATKITIANITYLSMTNIGTHPTIDELKTSSIETHIFSFDKEIYNEEVTLEFIELIRPEKKFNSIDDLKEELQRNKEYILSNFK